jgi:restriction endonuclease Mrr
MKKHLYRVFITCVLRQRNGRAPTRNIRELLLKLLKPLLSVSDYQRVRSGDVRWWNAVRWERDLMVRAGLLKSNSPKGIWELTEKGRRYADEHLAQLEVEVKRKSKA